MSRLTDSVAIVTGGAVGIGVNIASVIGLLAPPNDLGYGVGKSTVIAATRSMAIDFGPSGFASTPSAPASC